MKDSWPIDWARDNILVAQIENLTAKLKCQVTLNHYHLGLSTYGEKDIFSGVIEHSSQPVMVKIFKYE
ncbi:hypothetical protein Q6264_29160, partial [Klebsiella pneumoniae]|uniref:hypothetical protein n=1 Tax=Klebsiella pneumoniae TaxID=573 RepID=UPI00272F6BE2